LQLLASWQHAGVKLPHVSRQFCALQMPGVQHWPPTHVAGAVHVHPTDPQPFIAVVLQEFPQLGRLQHWLAMQFWFGPQLPQLTDDTPHEFVMTSQEFAGQVGVGQVHVFVDPLHVSPFEQFCEQLIVPPQPFGACLQ
jgi:hypothetical protein